MWRRFGRTWKANCSNITLHGFSNFSDARSIIESLFWILVWALCLALCVWLMLLHWVRYAARPTVTTIKSTTYPIRNIPFPAVTVCSSNLVHSGQAEYIKRMLIAENIPENTVDEFLENLKLLITSDDINTSKFVEIHAALKKMDFTTGNLMKNVTHPCNKMVFKCDWAGVQYNCSELFRPVITGLGLCCAFNYLNDVNDAEEKFKHQEVRRVSGFGNAHALTIQIDVDSKNYVSRIYPFYAAFVLVHPIYDYPDDSVFSLAIQPGDFAIMQVTPNIYQGDDSLRQLKVNDRECFFPNEGYLKSSFEYSFANCILECKAEMMQSLCKCVPYYYPSVGNFRQCTLMDVPCMKKYELQFNSVQVTEKVIPNTTSCQCLPQCEEENYDGSVNIVRNSLKGFASAQIFFQHSWCTLYNQNLNMTWDMLLASLGGIFGLCLGGSLISLVEVVYFLGKSFVKAVREGRKLQPAK